jgi:hypothetical protein
MPISSLKLSSELRKTRLRNDQLVLGLQLLLQ